MALTAINSEDRLVQQTFASHLQQVPGWDSLYAYNTETFGPSGTLGRASERDVVLLRDLREALERLNPDIPEAAREQAIEAHTRRSGPLGAPAQPRVLWLRSRRRAGRVA